MLRNRTRPALLLLAVVLAAAIAVAPAAAGGDRAEGVAFAVYADDAIGDRADDGWLRCGAPRAACPPNFLQPTGSYTYEPPGEPALGPRHTAGARTEAAGGAWSVSIELTGAGAKAFGDLTKRLAQEGKEEARPRSFAVVVGTEIVAYTTVHYLEFPEGIQTTSLELFATGEDDAKAIVERINAAVAAR